MSIVLHVATCVGRGQQAGIEAIDSTEEAREHTGAAGLLRRFDNEVHMIFARRTTAIAVLAWVVSGPLQSQQEPNPDRLFVRVQTPLRAQPSPSAPQAAVLRPGTLLTATADTPPSGGFVRVTGDNGQQGWVPAATVRPLAFLEAEQQLEPFGGLEGVRPTDRTLPQGRAGATAAQCQSFPSCPITGCATEASHKLTNTRKRTFPQSTSIKILTFDELDLLQALTDSKGIPQGEHLTAAQRKDLTNFTIGTQTISEGDHIAVTGFIAQDRTIRCGGAESVNCGHKNAGNAPDTSPCTRSDIHVPIVKTVAGRQVESVVTEPIPQGPNVKVWTPAAFMALKKQGRRLLIHGGLFYDSIHIVNTSESGSSQPKRFTVWELHPITAVLVCKRQDNKCDPATATDWTPLK